MLRHIIAFTAFLMLIPAGAYANADAARQYVDQVGTQVIGILDGPSDEKQKQQQLRSLFSSNVDMEWMGRFAVGPEWNKAREQERSAFLHAYRDYMLMRYTNNFSDYTGSNYTITGTKPENEGEYSVNMKIKSPKASDPDVVAGYRVRDTGGQFKITDIIIEGISLLTTQRSEFGAAIKSGGLAALTQQLQNKTTANQK